MPDPVLIEKLARAACAANGEDPDNWGEVLTGPYGFPRPYYATDGVQRPWHKYVKIAEEYLTHRAMDEAMRTHSTGGSR